MPETTNQQDSQKSMNKLRAEFENWLGMVVQQGEKALGAFGLNPQSTFQPDIDIVETNETVCICIDIPGIDPESIDLSIAGNMLRVRGLRMSCEASRSEDARVHLQERLTGSFDRSIPMPCQVLADEITAEASHGVLTVQLPKPEPERPHEIKIKVKTENQTGTVETTVI
ncbi:Spore protein SP21 [Polystyrenella longa]|uniref:Spore protein SP21 n=2 Tax=Polystyrenella longa TaxID=2528007 RepID=A0A518CP95_9PLAN|nr:Spore protein SP21 [Polystyrenella longa]